MAQLVINNFTRGKLDHDLNGRFDLPFYFNGFEVCRNLISNYKGNIKFRTGFKYEAQPFNNTEPVLKEFRFNTEQSYLLEFTENKLRFYTYDANGNFGLVSGVAGTSQPKFTSNSQDGYEVYSNSYLKPYKIFNGEGDDATLGYNWTGMTFQLKYPEKVAIKGYSLRCVNNEFSYIYPTAWSLQGSNDGNTWVNIDNRTEQKFSQGETKKYDVNNDKFYLYYRIYFTDGVRSYPTELDMLGGISFLTTTDEARVIELDTGITLEQAKKLQVTQNADAMYITMDEINPKILKREAANVFSIADVSPNGIKFDETGYPACVTFYSARLWYGGFSKKPLTVYGSEVAEYNNFVIPESNIDDEDPLELTLSEITDPIEWMVGGKTNLYVGNAEGITLINGGGYEIPITATEVNADLANKEGASRAVPTQKDSQVFYISNDRRKVYIFDYDLLTEKFLSTDLNWLAQDVTRGRLKEIHYKRDDNNIIYALLDNGQMVGLLYNSRESIMGWFPLETNGTATSMCTVTRPDGKDDLFIGVNRANGWNIERLAPEVEFTSFYDTPYYRKDKNKQVYNRLIAEELKQCVYLDNASIVNYLQEVSVTYDGNGTVTADTQIFSEEHVGHYIVYKTETGREYGYFRITEYISPTSVKVELESEGCYPNTWGRFYLSFNEVSGLEAFNGQKVPVVVDGGYLEEFEIQDGKLSLGREATSIVVGYGYEGILKTFNLGFYANGKNLQTTHKRISEFVLRFANSAGGKIGTDLDSMQEIQYFSINGFLDLPPLPMDGDEKRTIPDTTAEEKYIYLVQDLPLPLNLTMIQYNVQFS